MQACCDTVPVAWHGTRQKASMSLNGQVGQSGKTECLLIMQDEYNCRGNKCREKDLSVKVACRLVQRQNSKERAGGGQEGDGMVPRADIL